MGKEEQMRCCRRRHLPPLPPRRKGSSSGKGSERASLSSSPPWSASAGATTRGTAPRTTGATAPTASGIEKKRKKRNRRRCRRRRRQTCCFRGNSKQRKPFFPPNNDSDSFLLPSTNERECSVFHFTGPFVFDFRQPPLSVFPFDHPLTFLFSPFRVAPRFFFRAHFLFPLLFFLPPPSDLLSLSARRGSCFRVLCFFIFTVVAGGGCRVALEGEGGLPGGEEREVEREREARKLFAGGRRWRERGEGRRREEKTTTTKTLITPSWNIVPPHTHTRAPRACARVR